MVTEGIEPSTVALLAQRSNQLSYATSLLIPSLIYSYLSTAHNFSILFIILFLLILIYIRLLICKFDLISSLKTIKKLLNLVNTKFT